MVLLPAPFGSEEPEDLAGLHRQVDVVDGGDGLEDLGQAADLDGVTDRRRPARPMACPRPRRRAERRIRGFDRHATLDRHLGVASSSSASERRSPRIASADDDAALVGGDERRKPRVPPRMHRVRGRRHSLAAAFRQLDGDAPTLRRVDVARDEPGRDEATDEGRRGRQADAEVLRERRQAVARMAIDVAQCPKLRHRQAGRGRASDGADLAHRTGDDATTASAASAGERRRAAFDAPFGAWRRHARQPSRTSMLSDANSSQHEAYRWRASVATGTASGQTRMPMPDDSADVRDQRRPGIRLHRHGAGRIPSGGARGRRPHRRLPRGHRGSRGVPAGGARQSRPAVSRPRRRRARAARRRSFATSRR